MQGIDLNREITYCGASFRYFAPREYHITRYCKWDVLLLVFEGSLHFTEDGVSYEIGEGEYFIQKKGGHQSATHSSDAPKYLYVHFNASWTNEENGLPRRGTFPIEELFPLLQQMDRLAHSERSLTEKTAIFFQILSALYKEPHASGIEKAIAKYLREHLSEKVTLQELSRKFGYSKNQIINLMKKGYQLSPIEYQHRQRLKHAEWLLLVTSNSLQRIAEDCGYQDYSHFYKDFLRIYGTSPRQWRLKNRE